MITAVVYTEEQAIKLCDAINEYAGRVAAKFRKGYSVSWTEPTRDSWIIYIDLPKISKQLARDIVDILKPNPTLMFDPE